MASLSNTLVNGYTIQGKVVSEIIAPAEIKINLFTTASTL